MNISMQSEKNFKGVVQNNILKGAEVDHGCQNKSIGELLLDTFNDNPDYAAWVEDASGKQMTFAQMKDSSIRLALWLKHQGIGQNDVITLCSPNCLNNYIVLYATFYVGAVHNSWHHDFTLESARHAIKITKPKIIFTYTNIIDILTTAAKLENEDVKIIAFEDYPDLESIEDLIQMQEETDVQSFTVRKIEKPSSELAGIWFSSGTSGPPKGVMITYESILNRTLLKETKQNDVLLWYSTPYWLISVEYMLVSIIRKAKVVICQKYEPEDICQLIENYQVTFIITEPSFLTSVCKYKFVDKYKLTSLTKILFCGTKISEKTIKQFRDDFPHIELQEEYGMTEIGTIFYKCINTPSMGYFIPNVQVKIVDLETSKLLGSNEQGEICLKGPGLTVGYYNNPVTTSATIDKDGWLHSGDIGFYDENGELFIVDRFKNVIRFQYHHVYPSEIRDILLSHPDVFDASVTTFPHEEDVEHAIAFVQRVPGAKVTEEELVELSATLGYYKKLWGGVKFLDKLPRTSSGKVSMNALKEMAKSYVQQ